MEIRYDRELHYVRGDALRLYMGQSGISDRALAAEVYGNSRAESQRRRIKLLRERPITPLGTRGLDAQKELARLADALHLGPKGMEFLKSPAIVVLVKRERGLLVVAGGVIGWPDEDAARLAAVLAEDAGFEQPMIHRTTEAELRDLELHRGTDEVWRSLVDPFNAIDDCLCLLDFERYLNGADELLDPLALWNPGGLIFEHLGAVFHMTDEHPRNVWWLDRAHRLIERAMTIKVSPELGAELRSNAAELYSRLTPPVDASAERAVELERRAGRVGDADVASYPPRRTSRDW